MQETSRNGFSDGLKFFGEATQQALYVGTTSKFSLKQRHDVISSKLRRCSNVIWPLGSFFIDTSHPTARSHDQR